MAHLDWTRRQSLSEIEVELAEELHYTSAYPQTHGVDSRHGHRMRKSDRRKGETECPYVL